MFYVFLRLINIYYIGIQPTTIPIATVVVTTIRIMSRRCVMYDDGTADDVASNFAEKKVGSTLLNDVAKMGTKDGIEDGAVDGMIDKSSNDAVAPPPLLSSSVIPIEPTVGYVVGTGGGTSVGRNVMGATVTGTLVTGALEMGVFVTGAFVTGALDTGALVTGAGVVTEMGAGVDGITIGGDVEGGVVVVVVPPPPLGSFPKPDIRKFIPSELEDSTISVIVIPVDTIIPF